MLVLKTFEDAKFVVDGNALQTFITLSTKNFLSNASCASRFKQFLQVITKFIAIGDLTLLTHSFSIKSFGFSIPDTAPTLLSDRRPAVHQFSTLSERDGSVSSGTYRSRSWYLT